MKKLLCITDSSLFNGNYIKENLTIGKWYNLLDEIYFGSNLFYMVNSDIGVPTLYSKKDKYFMNERKQKLLELNEKSSIYKI